MTTLTFPPHIAALKPYVPGLSTEQVAQQMGIPPAAVVKLASNENPLGASPQALAALAAAATDVSRYPDADVASLSAALAQHHQVPVDWVVAGAGSEAVLGMVTAATLAPGRSAVFAEYSFQAFVNGVQRSGGVALSVPSPNHTVDLQGLLAAIRPDTALVYVANPGNPTGTLLPPAELETFVAQVPPRVVVLLDEAYHEYVPLDQQGDAIAWVRRHPNLVVARTFSKAYGLAGLRVGYGVAQPALAGMLKRLRAPFSVTQAAQVAAVAALNDQAFLAQTVASNAEAKALLVAGLDRLGLPHLPSHTNFVLVRVGAGSAVAAALKQKGLVVRPVDNYGLPEWLRVSVGTVTEVERLLVGLAEVTKTLG